jgi:hypothetical protein
MMSAVFLRGTRLLAASHLLAFLATLFLLLWGGGRGARLLLGAEHEQCLSGPSIRYDDYDYGEVNQLLERNLKIYIKTVACYPEKTTRRMYNLFWRHFRHSEKVMVTRTWEGLPKSQGTK